ncbi:VTT domain-containing protein [Francisella sp. Scap27]|uniref:TVP38/TMEM64 family protein n=1 Tax=Francisella sp. Scap27 TaxID=2589986 RepID=UPI0015B7B65A|nr:VTT domain-containing protein [Francisella sp. Scap27]QLE79796.1 VTT domain-containing protein [Francisella sp. Scap27]
MKRLLLVVFFCLGLILFFILDGFKYFNLNEIQHIYYKMVDYSKLNYIKALFIYIFLYISAVFFSIPIKPFLKIIGGLIFGLWIGFISALFSATTGAMLVFLCVKYGWGRSVDSGKVNYYSKFKILVQNHPVSTLLASRLLPLPFFIPNILAGILQIKSRVFFLTTLVGIIPVTFVYVWLGTHLGKSLSREITNFIDYKFVLALGLLGLLALLPLIGRSFLNRQFKK